LDKNIISFKDFYEIYTKYSDLKYFIEESELRKNLFYFIGNYFGFFSKEMLNFKEFDLKIQMISNACFFNNCEKIKLIDEKDLNKKLKDVQIEIDYDIGEVEKLINSLDYCLEYINEINKFIEKNYYEVLLKLIGLNSIDKLIIDKVNNSFAFKYQDIINKEGIMHIYEIDNKWFYSIYTFDKNNYCLRTRKGLLDKYHNMFLKKLPNEIKNLIFDIEELI